MNPSLAEVAYGPGKIARYEGSGRWQVFYVARSGARRPERPAMTRDVLAKQGSDISGTQQVERVVRDLG
jgi:hypothetical protein